MNLWTTLITWTPWHTLIAFGAGILWLVEWVRIIPAEGAVQRAQSLRGDVFHNYRQSLRDGLNGFSCFIGDKYDDGQRNFSAASFLASAGWAFPSGVGRLLLSLNDCKIGS